MPTIEPRGLCGIEVEFTVTFTALDDDAIWNAEPEPWPDGWSVRRTGTSGSRVEVSFSVTHLPTQEEVQAVAKAIDQLDQAISFGTSTSMLDRAVQAHSTDDICRCCGKAIDYPGCCRECAEAHGIYAMRDSI